MVSKLGPHVIRPTGDALDWARHAPVVKALDDTGALRAAGARAEILIYRKYFPTQDINRNGGDVMAEVAAALGEGPATHVECFNECYQRLGQGLERYVEFTREAVRWLKERRPGWTLVGYCFSTGQPEQEDWEYLRQHEYGGATVIGLHEYWGNQGFTPWHALRHRTAHAWTEGDHPLFLVTECGRDRVEGGKGGWRADGLTEDAYLAELLAYEQELLRDPYVIAATPFTGGPTPDWTNFDTDPLSGRLVAASGPLPAPPEEVPVDWCPFATKAELPAGLYSPTRDHGRAPSMICDHIAEGNGDPGPWWTSLLSRPPNERASAHLWVSKAGLIKQYVRFSAQAWSNGPLCESDLTNPLIAGIVAAGTNPNAYTISIEHEGFPGEALPAAQTAASRKIHRWLNNTFAIPLDRTHVVGHYQFDRCTRKNCPGPAFPWGPILAQEVPVPNPTPDATALQEKAWALGDQLQKLAQQYESIGYPHRAAYVRSQGEAVKEWVNTASKDQR